MTATVLPLRHVVVAVTGASGAIYGLRLVETLLAAGCRVSLLLSAAGEQVLRHETGLAWGGAAAACRERIREHFASDAVDFLAIDDLFAPLASGSSAADAMVIAPCSMGTAGRLAAGLSGNLLERTADVMLKERRPLLLVPRETPLSSIHLENLLRLSQAGALIVPAMPAFYHEPASIAELVDFVVGKVLDQLRLPHTLYRRWGAPAAAGGPTS
ncbi:MAG: flavin prenyltransferase UbiX [Desulfuromonadales bacterium]|nr:flavin prenyltransferase UbiX [Desulfuromonadales bacterium]